MFSQKGSTTLIVVVLLVALMVGVGGSIILMAITYKNQEQALRTDIEDQQRKIEANFDSMWKIITQKVQVLDKYSDDFKEVVRGYTQGRYGQNGSQAMFQWLKEHNVPIDASLYKEIMVTIEARRLGFEREQRILSEMAAQHKKFYVTMPSMWFVSGSPVQVQIISSDKTKAVIESGRENDTELFKDNSNTLEKK